MNGASPHTPGRLTCSGSVSSIIDDPSTHRLGCKQPLDRIPVDLSRNKALFVPDGPDVRKYAYRTDFATMRRIASSHDLAV